MPDWRRIVGNRLAGIALESREREEVIEELAAHFDDVYEDLRKQGLTEACAVRRSLGEVQDWRNLRRKIQIARRKENDMPDRVKQFWLPSLLTLVLFMISMSLIHLFSVLIFGHPSSIATHNGMPRMVPATVTMIPWLLLLPLLGAGGAFVSHRAGGTLRAMLSSALFPVVPFLVFFAVGIPSALSINDRFARGIMVTSFLDGLVLLTLLPAVALLAGAISYQLFLSRRPGGGALAQPLENLR